MPMLCDLGAWSQLHLGINVRILNARTEFRRVSRSWIEMDIFAIGNWKGFTSWNRRVQLTSRQILDMALAFSSGMTFRDM